MYIRKQRLLTAGPTPLYPPALHAMMASDLHHRTEDFRRLYRQTLSDLREVLCTGHAVLPFVSSGTGAMEAAVSNLFRRGDRVIVCSAGKFGERWVEIARTYGLDPVVLSAVYGEAVPVESVARAMVENPSARGVLVQASESSTGAAHDVRGMAEAVARTEAIFVVDAITGFGTMPLDLDNWGLDVVIGGSQKAFMIPPGLAFLTISPKAWRFAESCDLPHFYFDLRRERKVAAAGESSWTPATSLMLAFAEALRYIKSVGMTRLVENAQLLARATRAAVTEVGLELFAPHSPGAAVTSVKAPPGMDSGVIVKQFKERFGFIMNNGQGSMKGKIFRVAHLGYFDFADLFAVIAGLEVILAASGFPVRYGAGVAAVQHVYAEAAAAREPVHA